ncbi:DUF6944 family repetitive protein [Metabacillus arenae]|uniref:Uncharacterized protein n=1 Tax=Metabacillus arenae TaxID=2771434 RepID=A0A926NEH8_9BACI|nr:hypothetical protein [Metabacillus arenae]MBD1382019.1 hypothetical protein [Metabacillus arenae]
MNTQFKEILGSEIAAVGTIMSAIGNTPSISIPSDLQNSLDLWGNVLQAAGNALQADGQEEISLEKIGNEVQSIGNITVIAGTVIDFEKESQQKLVISGNLLQALGGLVSMADEIGDDDSSAGRSYSIIGNLLQSIGNSMQAIGGGYELKENYSRYIDRYQDKNGQVLITNGSWIQAIGSVLSVIGQIKEESQETNDI